MYMQLSVSVPLHQSFRTINKICLFLKTKRDDLLKSCSSKKQIIINKKHNQNQDWKKSRKNSNQNSFETNLKTTENKPNCKILKKKPCPPPCHYYTDKNTHRKSSRKKIAKSLSLPLKKSSPLNNPEKLKKISLAVTTH